MVLRRAALTDTSALLLRAHDPGCIFQCATSVVLSELQDPTFEDVFHGELVHHQLHPILHFEHRFQNHRFQ